MAEESDLPPPVDNPIPELKRRVDDLSRDNARLQQDVVILKAELANLHSYVLGFKGDGSGVEFKGNTVSLRLQIPKPGMNQVNSTLEVKDEGSSLTMAATTLDFTGSGVTATAAGGVVTIDIPGGAGTEATYIMIKLMGDDTLEAHAVTLTGTDLGAYTES